MDHEATLRFGVFIALLLAMLMWEWFRPCRSRNLPRTLRWPNNLGLAAFNTLLLRLLLPTASIGAASWAALQDWGLLPLLNMPYVLTLLLGVLMLDLLIYAQHRLVHGIPLLWRLHRVHHTDVDFDVTTGIRFHPLEILFSISIKLLAVILLGVPPLAALLFEVLLNATSLFNHGNVRLPKRIDQVLRCLIVTPDMHRVHHSTVPQETNSNFGFNLPWWDYLFSTYRAQPAAGHRAMSIGLDYFRAAHEQRLPRLLLQPFRNKPNG